MNEVAEKSIGSMEEDAVLVKAFQGGDKIAFDTLVLKHKDKLFNMVYWFLGDYQEANDCAQETFIKVFKSIKTFRFESAFSTWLYRIAINTCKNRLKSSAYRWKQKTVPLENPGDAAGGGASSEIRNNAPSPAIELEKKEKLITGLNLGTVKSRLARGRLALRNQLKGKI
jgi:RNA polymerase sigma-70 factor (ECF subfamily)